MPSSDSPDKFVWPPKPIAGGSAGMSVTSSPAHEASHPSSAAATPRITAPSRRAADSISIQRPPFSWWRQIEEAWLGLVTPPFAQRALDADWTPDSLESYCPRCGHDVGPHEALPNGTGRTSCPRCRTTKPKFSRVVRLGTFDGLLRDAIHEVKFSAWRRLGTELGQLLGTQLAAALDSANVSPDRVVLVPMPTTTRRRLARGIDHTTVLARGAQRVLNVPIVHAVDREHRPSQTQVPQSQRRDNVTRTMRFRGGADLFARLVVIVDDVMTTGSTMGECARALREGTAGEKQSPLDIWAAVVAVTPSDDGARKHSEPSPENSSLRTHLA